MSKHKQFDYEPAMPEEEVSWRMGSSAGRKLQRRLRDVGALSGQEGEAQTSPADES